MSVTRKPPPAAQRAEAAQQLRGIFDRLLDRDDVDPAVHFADLGGDSILTLSLLVELEERFDLALTPTRFARHGSVDALAALVAGERAAPPRLAVIQAGDGTAPLFLAHALGGVTAYAGWLAELLGPRQMLVLLQWRAPDPDEPVSLEAHAAAYVAAIRRMQPDGPYRLAGHSFGGMLAYEVACQIAEAGGHVGFLGLFDRVPLLHARNVGIARRAPASRRATDLCDRMLRSHVPRHYPGDLWLFRPGVATTGVLADPTSGWGDLVRGRVHQVQAEGTHGGMMSRDVLRRWVVPLRQALDSPAPLVAGRQDATRAWSERPDVAAATAGRLAARQGDLEAEIAAWRAAIDADPRQPHWVWRNLSAALEEAGDLDGAVQALDRAAEAEAVPIVACTLMWRLLRQAGRPDAERWADRARGHDADTVPVQLALGKLDQLRGDADAAERRFRRVLDLCPIHEPAARRLQQILQDGGRVAEALAVARRVAQLLPGEVKPLLDIARLAALLGDGAARDDAARAVLAIRPGQPDALRLLDGAG